MNLTFMWFTCLWLGVGSQQNCVQKLDSLVVRNIYSYIFEGDSLLEVSSGCHINKTSLDTIIAHTMRLRKLVTPFENTEFYMYKFHYNPELIKYGYCGKIGMGVIYRTTSDIQIVPDSTINQVDKILQGEKQLNKQSMLKLCRLLMCITSWSEYWIFHDKSEGINADDMDTLSVLNKRYPTPKVERIRSGISVEFFCCLQDRGNIYKVIVKYNFATKKIKVTSHDLGRYGRTRFRID